MIVAMRRALAIAIVLVGSIGCGRGGGRPPLAAGGPVAPVAVAPVALTQAEAEAALLASPAWRVDATIRATGQFTADLEATAIVAVGNRARLRARGTFLGQPAAIDWVSDGTVTSTGGAAPPATGEAIAIGIARMGLLHNLVRAMNGAGPDHAEGGAAAWVEVVGPRPLAADRVAFGLRVDGEDAADVELTLAAPGPVMTARRITVRFPGGEMTVEETYRFTLAYTPAADDFAAPPPP
jgi:hypothetical protein